MPSWSIINNDMYMYSHFWPMKYSKIKKSSSSSDHYRNISPPCWLALETQTLPQGGRICPLYPPSGDRDADYHHPPHTPRGPKRPNSLNGRLSQTRENFPDNVRESFFILHPLFFVHFHDKTLSCTKLARNFLYNRNNFRTGRKISKLTSAFRVFLKVSKLFRLSGNF